MGGGGRWSLVMGAQGTAAVFAEGGGEAGAVAGCGGAAAGLGWF